MAEHWCSKKEEWAPGYTAGCHLCHKPVHNAKHNPIFRSVKDSTNPNVERFLATGDPTGC